MQRTHPIYFQRLAGIVLALVPVVAPAAGREANTTLQMPPHISGSASHVYFTQNAFTGVLFAGGPVAVCAPPGETGRLFVVENAGFVSVITNLAAPTRTVFLDISDRVFHAGAEGLLGLAFHPEHAGNGQFFLCYVDDRGVDPDVPATQSNRLNVLSRWQVDAGDPHRADTNSEAVFIAQRDDSMWHNLNDLHFGPDGYLYFAMGDEGAADDTLGNSQRIDRDFFSAIGRIDVDKQPGSLAPNPHPAIGTNELGEAFYAVPPDNPFIGATQFNGLAVDPGAVRTEFYAVGLRNPWRFSIDPVTGWMLCGDVGQGAREEVNRIERGGNYGWAYWEGSIPGPRTPLVPLDQPGNLLTNSSMEEGVDLGVIHGWSRQGQQNVLREIYSGWGYTLGPGTFPHGSRALKGFGSGSRLVQSGRAVTGGVPCVASGYFYHSTIADGIATNALSTRMAIEVEWFDGDSQSLGVSTSSTHNGLTLPDTWLEIRLTNTAPADAERADFSVVVTGQVGGGSVWGDLFYFGDGHDLPPQDTAGNLLANSSFEYGIADDDFAGWERDPAPSIFRETAAGFGYALGAGTFPDGRHALKAWGGGSHLYQTNLPVWPGSNYLVRAMFYHSTEEDGIHTNELSTRIFARVEWFDAGGQLLGQTVTPSHHGLSPADRWVEVRLSTAAPPAAATAAFHLETDTDMGVGSVWADTVYFGIPPAPGHKISGSLSFIPPLYEYDRAVGQAKSITGGFVYRGDQFPELVGQYIFADFSDGFIRAMEYDGTNAGAVALLAYDDGIVGVHPDPRNGEILLSDVFDQRIKRLVRVTVGGNLPETLADTGIFADLETLDPEPGIVPYDINVPFWSDGAGKSRWFCLPGLDQVMDFNAEAHWGFPTGMVWVKHFELKLTNGVPESARRLETRVLVKNETGAYGVTYRWGLSRTNAVLVPAEGLDEHLRVEAGGVVSTQVWRYPSRAECLACHTEAGGIGLGFNTPQLNLAVPGGSGSTNQIDRLESHGYFSGPVENRHLLRALAPWTNAAHSLEYRVRSYLQANCGQCHVPNGPVQPEWSAWIFTPLSQARIVDAPLLNDLENPDHRVVAPGDPAHSMLLARIAATGNLRMPPLASNVPDTNSIARVAAWIESLAGYQSYAQWRIARFGSDDAPDSAPSDDADEDGADNATEYLTGTDPLDDLDYWVVDGLEEGVAFWQVPNRIFRVEAATRLEDADWEPLNVAGNEPFISSTASGKVVLDPETNLTHRFYRVRILEP
jgi:glucose/arabinose dehydrogenase